MSETADKKNNLSIWDSVVDDKIKQYEELRGKYVDRGILIDDLTAENASLKEANDMLQEMAGEAEGNGKELERLATENKNMKSRLSSLEADVEKKDAMVRQLQIEVANLRKGISNMENSTSWKITSPIRKILNVFRHN